MKKLIVALILLISCNAWAADSKVSDLTAITSLTTDDLLYAVDGGTASRKITWDNSMLSITKVATSVGNGLVKNTAGTLSAITDSSSNWDSGYTYRLTSATGTSPLTLNLSSNALTGSVNLSGFLSDGTKYVPYSGATSAVVLGSWDISFKSATAATIQTDTAKIGSLTGVLKGTSGTVGTATAGTDYQAVGNYLTNGTLYVPYSGATSAVVLGSWDISGKSATYATLQTDTAKIGTSTGLLKATSGAVGIATSGTDYQPAGTYLTDGLRYVPYTGATGSVVLGNYNLSASTSTSSVVSVNATGGAYYLPYSFGASGQTIVLQTDGTTVWQTAASGVDTDYYQTVEDEGTPVTQRTNMNFTGAGVSVADSGGKTVVTIPGGGATSTSGSVVAIFGGYTNSSISTYSTLWVRVPYACTLTEWELTANATPSVLILDVWKTSYNTFQTATGPTICNLDLPTLSNVQKNKNTTLTNWSTSVSAGDYLFFQVASNQGPTYATEAVIAISYTK